MPCARKRLHERCVVQIDEIAYRLGYLCKRVLAFDLVNQCGRKKRSRSPDPPPAASDLIRGKNATYWSEAATSLSTEAAQLREEIRKRNREYQSILECNARLLTSYREMERRLLGSSITSGPTRFRSPGSTRALSLPSLSTPRAGTRSTGTRHAGR